ncbi:olfactory receptor 11L1-like [Hyperolius riggenbachi]|uniref:olfactory receptor 11L1-like n=1 Tax=Hyperolius riggenbachi TaxID=752182 RepID=UPI0035A2C4ED
MGFPDLHHFNFLLCFFVLIIYCMSISGNMVIIALVSISKTLHFPMYFFIVQVSILDILLTTDVVSIMFPVILYEGVLISLSGCIAQFFFFATVEGCECLLLTVMSYDRYLAICNPFHYSSIVNKLFCIKVIFLAWLLSSFMTLCNAAAMCNLSFCGPNSIDHFFCDLPPLMKLICSDASIVHGLTYFICISVIICPFIIIVISYIYIVFTIVRIPSITGRQKAFSTCSSHLTVVCLFYGALISVYVVPQTGDLLTLNKVMSLFYTLVTPVLNPLIYTLRNKDFKEAFQKCRHCVL